MNKKGNIDVSGVLMIAFLILMAFVLLIAHNDGDKRIATCNIPRDMKALTLDSQNYANGGFLFFIGMYQSGEHQMVRFIVKDLESGGYKIINIDVRSVTIFEDGGKSPYATSCGDTDWSDWNLHIPPNSIIENYKVDIKDLK